MLDALLAQSPPARPLQTMVVRTVSKAALHQVAPSRAVPLGRRAVRLLPGRCQLLMQLVPHQRAAPLGRGALRPQGAAGADLGARRILPGLALPAVVPAPHRGPARTQVRIAGCLIKE